MAIKLRIGGTLRDITSIRMRIGGSLRAIKSVKVMIGGELKLVYTQGGGTGSFTVSFSPGSAYGSNTSNVVTTGSVTAMVSGGVPPFSYLWTVVSYSAATPPSIQSATFATTKFVQTDVIGSESAVIRCTVTDSVGSTNFGDIEAVFDRNFPEPEH